jgi:microcystin-dependent protein
MSSPFLAEIRPFPYTFAPKGWAMCQGQILPIAQNTALFSLLGTNYGGNGVSTFGLPNLVGTVPMHYDQGPGLSNYVIGETAGSSTVTVLQTQLPSHGHSLNAFVGRGPKAGNSPASAVLTSSGGSDVYDTTTPQNPALLSPAAVQPTGGSQPHNNMMPYLVINFCIALTGIFPARG